MALLRWLARNAPTLHVAGSATWRVASRHSDTDPKTMKFVLATAAYNEEKFIEKTMRSVVAQSLRPVKWVIVSDGSTDRTDEIVRSYAAQHEFISLHRITEKHARNFGAQVRAINTGYEKLKGLDFDFFGNVDADVALPPNYYASLAQKFDADAKLGLAGGFIHEDSGRGISQPVDQPYSIRGPCHSVVSQAML